MRGQYCVSVSQWEARTEEMLTPAAGGCCWWTHQAEKTAQSTAISDTVKTLLKAACKATSKANTKGSPGNWQIQFSETGCESWQPTNEDLMQILIGEYQNYLRQSREYHFRKSAIIISRAAIWMQGMTLCETSFKIGNSTFYILENQVVWPSIELRHSLVWKKSCWWLGNIDLF